MDDCDPNKIVVIQTAPAVRVALGEGFGYEPGSFLEGKMVGALRALGADYVVDTNFGADLTIMEEASELVKRLQTGALYLNLLAVAQHGCVLRKFISLNYCLKFLLLVAVLLWKCCGKNVFR